MAKKEIQNNAELITTADIVDGILILSMPNAITPSVWQYDIASAKETTFQIEVRLGVVFIFCENR